MAEFGAAVGRQPGRAGGTGEGMQTVNFHCGHCGNLMAVGAEYLGQQVRCPHCQQIVLAPAVTPSGSPLPTLSAENQIAERPHQEPESIFTPPEEHTDDLFGAAPAPKLELPSGGSWPSATPNPSAPASAFNGLTAEGAPPESRHENRTESASEMFGEPPTSNGSAPKKTPDVTAPAHNWAPADDRLAPSTPDQAVVSAGSVRGYQASGRSLSMALIIIPLISYSILATIAVVILYFRTVPDPLEALPDDGDYRGAKHKQTSSLDDKRIVPTSPLPAKLKATLGETITIGDLEVTPQRIERRAVIFRRPLGRPDKGGDDTLVLHLHLRNISQDLVFCPTDPYFDRRFRAKQGGNRPYMYVEVGGQQYFGGPLEWFPADKKDAPRETIDGQHYGQALGPGEEMDTIVCTDPEARVASALERVKGAAVWRVQLRRGLVQVRGREIPVTAVIGVVFRKEDVRRG